MAADLSAEYLPVFPQHQELKVSSLPLHCVKLYDTSQPKGHECRRPSEAALQVTTFHLKNGPSSALSPSSFVRYDAVDVGYIRLPSAKILFAWSVPRHDKPRKPKP